MEKKFKCQSCGTEFMADTNQYVTCPNCDSDNVALAKGGSKVFKIIAIIIAALVVIGVAAIVILKVMNNTSAEPAPTTTPDPIVNEPVEPGVEPAEAIIPLEYEKPEIAFTKVGIPAYDTENDSYSISVTATIQGPQASDFTVNYKVSDIAGTKVIATSNSGIFVGLKPIAVSANNPEASYQITALAMKGNECVDSVSTTVSDFKVKSRNLVEKMTVAEVQALIDSKASASVTANNPRLAANVSIRCNGNTGGEPAPKTLRKLIERLKMSDAWEGARVVSLEYDDNNCVKCIVITPVLSNE